MGKLKIGIVLDDTLDTPDGVQQYVLAVGKWLSEQGHTVHYLVGSTKRTDIPHVHSLGNNVRVQFNGNRMSTPLPASRRKITRLLLQEKYDVLHVMIPYSPFLAAQIITAAPVTTAVVGTFHIAPNSALVTMANKALSFLNKKSLRRFDSIVSVSPAAAAFAEKTHGITTPIVPNVIRTDHFKSAKPEASDRPTIMFLGRLVPRKGCQILLEALNHLKNDAAMPDYQALICGRGPLETELKAYTRANGLEDRVRFVGFVNDDEKARYLRAADLAVFPSTGGESFGIVLIEAMAAEHPVVLGAANAGYTSVLEQYPDLLFPTHDPVRLAEKIREFLTDSNAHQRALKWQKAYVKQFDIAIVGPRLVARYQEALRSRLNA
jgi:phosphatidylinositol alpha-mannosyltransferase